MKRYFEIFLVIFILFFIIYFLLYVFSFNSLCNKYSWINEQNYIVAIKKLASCKDSLVCYPNNIEVNQKNEVTDWNCVKKDSPLFWSDLYMKIFNNFKISIIK
jgi:hypothetical protein